LTPYIEAHTYLQQVFVNSTVILYSWTNTCRWYQITKKEIEFHNLNKWNCAQSTLVPGALQYIR